MTNIGFSHICDWLSQGKSLRIKSSPFNVTNLRKLAKAAKEGHSTMTIVAEDELTATDCDSITDEAPQNVVIDLTEIKIAR